MSSHLNHDRLLLDEATPLACPHCTELITPESPACGDCGIEITIVDGIPSLRPGHSARDAGVLETGELAALAAHVERGSVREATADYLATHERRSTVLSQLFDIERDAWQALAAPHISGRCLDVTAGFGRRAMTLAERCDVVYAVDPNVSKLRIAAARDDYASSERVVPLHTTEDVLPFELGSFDTIVADFTGSSTTDVQVRLNRLFKYLADDGTLLFVADGWPRRSGVTELIGGSEIGSESDRELTRGAPRHYRSIIDAVGFDNTTLYALVPSAERPLYAFDVESNSAVRTLAAFELPAYSRFAEAGASLLSFGHRSGLLNWGYPSVLAVCTADADSSAPEFDDPLLVPGRARSVVLETSETGIERVWKLPNRTAHAPLTERENAVLSYLTSRDHPITDTLPNGEGTESPLGTARREQPVDGKPLGTALADNLRSYERVLRLGFDWLIEFQNAFRGPTTVRSPDEVRTDLQFEPTDLEPPAVDEPVETFFTPVHGDYLAGNIHVRDGAVTSVIDWEYAAAEANPVIDAGFFVLNTATRRFGSMDKGIRQTLCGENEYARVTKSIIRGYCDEVGLPYQTFEVYLPIVFVHRLELDWQFDAVSTYTQKLKNRTRAIEIAFEHRPRIELG